MRSCSGGNWNTSQILVLISGSILNKALERIRKNLIKGFNRQKMGTRAGQINGLPIISDRLSVIRSQPFENRDVILLIDHHMKYYFEKTSSHDSKRHLRTANPINNRYTMGPDWYALA